MSSTPIYDAVAGYLGDPFGVVGYSIAASDDPWIMEGFLRAREVVRFCDKQDLFTVIRDRQGFRPSHDDALSATLTRYLPSEETNMQVSNNGNHEPEIRPEDPVILEGQSTDPGDRLRFYDELSDPVTGLHGWRRAGETIIGAEDYESADGRGIRIWWNEDDSFSRASYFVDGKLCAMHHTSNDPYDALIDAVRGRDHWVYPVVQAADLFPPQPLDSEIDYGPSLDDNDPRIPVAEAPTPEEAEMVPERLAFLLDHPEQATHDEIQRGLLALQVMRERPKFSIGLPPEAAPELGKMYTLPDEGRMTGTVVDGLLGYVERERQLHPEPVDDGKYVNPGAALAQRQAVADTEEERVAAPTMVGWENPKTGEIHVEQGLNLKGIGKPIVGPETAQKIADRIASLGQHLEGILGSPLGAGDDEGLPKDEVAETTAEQSVLDDAATTISTGRQDDYGNAEDSFDTIASFWQTYLCARLGLSKDILIVDGRDVAQMMSLLKTARDTQSRKRDNLVDGAGYLALAERAVGSDR